MRVSISTWKRSCVSTYPARSNSVTSASETLKFANSVLKTTGLTRAATSVLMPHVPLTNVINATRRDQVPVMFVMLATSFLTVDVLIAIRSLKACIARVVAARQCAQIALSAIDLKMVSARHVRPRLVLSVTSAPVDAMLANQECLLTNLANVCPAKPRVKSAKVLISAQNVLGRCTV